MNAHTTTNYEIFKTLHGNRSINEKHVKALVDEIKSNGYMESKPIEVNEKFQIIDGQHRFEALKILHMPILYVVREGFGIADCSKINSLSLNWTNMDFVNMYAQMDNENYKVLKHMRESIPLIPLIAIAECIGKKANSADIRSGRFELDSNIHNAFEVLSDVSYCLENAYGSCRGVNKKARALMFAFRVPNVKRKFLMDRFIRNIQKYGDISTTKYAVQCINDLYNHGLKNSENRIDFVGFYKKYISERGKQNV